MTRSCFGSMEGLNYDPLMYFPIMKYYDMATERFGFKVLLCEGEKVGIATMKIK